jgi:hypothetical protein
MKPESRLKDIQIALKLADWFSTEEHVDYNADLSLGHLFVNGKIVFYDSTVLEFTESITPDGLRYRYQYMEDNGNLIFRYDNVPHHPQLSTFPDHKHDKNTTTESGPVDLKQVVEEIIDYIIG